MPVAQVLAAAVSSCVVAAVGALTNVPSWDAVVERAEPYFGSIH